MLFLSFPSKCLWLGDQLRFMVRKFHFFIGARPLCGRVSVCCPWTCSPRRAGRGGAAVAVTARGARLLRASGRRSKLVRRD